MMKTDTQSDQQSPTLQTQTKQKRQTTQDVKSTKFENFQAFKLRKQLILGLCNLGYKQPTPVQQQSIPLILQRKSIIARAKNGTGKTGAFLIPIINQIKQGSNFVEALILVPTRELALQIFDLTNQLSKFMKIKVGLFIGGNNTNQDLNKLDQNLNILIGTTGRVKQIIRRRPALLQQCRFFVLDQADKLISTDFQSQIQQILQKIKNPQILLYSATFPVTIRPFKQKWLPKAQVLNLMDQLMLIGLTHYYILVDEKDKIKALNTIYSKLIIHQCIIFCRSYSRVQMLSKKLRQKNYQNLYLHSKMSPVERTKVFSKFKSGQVKTLVSSDLCARGIDVQSVNVVINFDFPSNSDTYLHRIGRSGRFGQIGLAINLITEKDQQNVIKIEKQLETQIDALPNQVDPSLYT